METKKTIIGIIAGFIIAAIVIAAGCVSTVEPVEETPVVVPEVPVDIVSADDIIDEPVEEKEPVQWLRSFPDKKSDSSDEEVPGIWIKGHFIPFSEIM